MVGLRVSDLTHEFEYRTVFRSVNYAFDGACLAVMGPNGSGKSTLLRILAGLLTPTAGEAAVMLDGKALPRQELRNRIGLCAPDIRPYADLTARENLTFLMNARGRCPNPDHISHTLERIGLSERADSVVQELSSGLRQRVMIALALIHDPILLLLDEPFSNLDEPGREMVRSVIGEFANRGMVVIATNDPSEAALAETHLDLGALV